MKHLRLLIVCSIISLSIYSQNNDIDNLLKEYETQTEDSLKINSLVKICSYYFFRNPKEGFRYADELADLAKGNGISRYASFSYRFRGNYYTKTGDFKKAIQEFENSINFLDSLGQPEKDKYADYVNIGTAYKYAKDYTNADYFYNKAILIVEENGNKDRLIVIYNNLGAMEASRENYEKAIEHYLKALENKQYNKNPKRLISANNNLALIYYELKQFDKALVYLEESLELSEKTNNPIGLADSKMGIAKCQIEKQTKSPYSIELLSDAAKIYKNNDDNVYLLEAYSLLGIAYTDYNNISESIKYHNKAIDLAEKIEMEDNVFGTRISLANTLYEIGQYDNSMSEVNYLIDNADNKNLLKKYLSDAYKLSSQISKTKGDYRKAYKAHLKFKELSDSLISIEKTKNINEIETKYQTEQKEKENQILRAEKAESELTSQKASIRNWILTFSLVVALLVLLSYVQFARQKRKELHYNSSLAILSAKQQEQQEIGMELHDSITKKLEQTVMTLQQKGEAKVSEEIISINFNLREIAKKLSFVDFQESSFSDQIVTLAASYQNENLKINIRGLSNIDWKKIKEPIKYNLYLIIREAISNSYNHSNASNIVVSFSKVKKEVSVSVEDNGEGFEKDKIAYGSGLRNMKVRVKDMNGTININSTPNSGTNVAIQFVII